jgi:RNA polymerase sigma-70 factor, ECF subfamily
MGVEHTERTPSAMDAQTERLIEIHADRAYSIALRMTGNAADAGDVVQEAFLRVMRYMNTYDPTYPFEAWLSQIIRNVYLNSLRVEARRRSVPLSNAGEDDDAYSLEERLADAAPGPERAAEAQDTTDEVHAALAALGANLRMAVILVDLEGVEREHAAQALGCSLSALDVRLHRGRARLRQEIENRRMGAKS